jgi:hypothetical protein
MFRIHVSIASVYRQLELPEKALEHAELGLLLNPNIIVLDCFKIENLMRLGRTQEAKDHARQMHLRSPAFRVSSFIVHQERFRNRQEVISGYAKALTDAGLPT